MTREQFETALRRADAQAFRLCDALARRACGRELGAYDARAHAITAAHASRVASLQFEFLNSCGHC